MKTRMSKGMSWQNLKKKNLRSHLKPPSSKFQNQGENSLIDNKQQSVRMHPPCRELSLITIIIRCSETFVIINKHVPKLQIINSSFLENKSTFCVPTI